MYQTRFGLRQRPFRATPDTAFNYPATCHERALALLLRGIADDEGLMLLAGEPGSGKTLLCLGLMERLGSDITSVFLTNSHYPDRAGLFQAILYDLSLPYQDESEQDLRLALTDQVLKNCAGGGRTLLLIDEAQHLTPDLLEELRLLGNLEGRNSKAVQVILAAQPQLEQTLRLPELAAFQQRLAVRAWLEALDVHEAADYLVHQLRTAGGRPEHIITDEALEMLARGTKGIPRVLNQAAHLALTIACSSEATLVDAEVALEALEALGLSAEEEGELSEGEGPGEGANAVRESKRRRCPRKDRQGMEKDFPPNLRSASRAVCSPGRAAVLENLCGNGSDLRGSRSWEKFSRP
jgi:general secretion pathway protein A